MNSLNDSIKNLIIISKIISFFFEMRDGKIVGVETERADAVNFVFPFARPRCSPRDSLIMSIGPLEYLPTTIGFLMKKIINQVKAGPADDIGLDESREVPVNFMKTWQKTFALRLWGGLRAENKTAEKRQNQLPATGRAQIATMIG